MKIFLRYITLYTKLRSFQTGGIPEELGTQPYVENIFYALNFIQLSTN